MAERLAGIIGTEEDKVNCSFYFKIGACRHGDNCTRIHLKPTQSQTIVIPHMYDNPPVAIALSEGTKLPENMIKEAVRHFEDFYEEIFLELANYGELEDVIVTDNIGDHIIGNCYAKYYDEDDAERAMKSLTGRYYAGKLIMPEYSPVTNFRDAKCRQFEEGTCSRGGFCNFMHLKYVSKSFKKSLFRQMYDEHPEYLKKKKERDSQRRDAHGGRSGSREKERERQRSGSRKKTRKRTPSRDRDRRSDSRGKDRKNKKRDRRSRSRSANKEKERDQKDGYRNSEERRAMIASWNKDDD
jgi:splicing factor U2AF subunit